MYHSFCLHIYITKYCVLTLVCYSVEIYLKAKACVKPKNILLLFLCVFIHIIIAVMSLSSFFLQYFFFPRSRVYVFFFQILFYHIVLVVTRPCNILPYRPLYQVRFAIALKEPHGNALTDPMITSSPDIIHRRSRKPVTRCLKRPEGEVKYLLVHRRTVSQRK